MNERDVELSTRLVTDIFDKLRDVEFTSAGTDVQFQTVRTLLDENGCDKLRATIDRVALDRAQLLKDARLRHQNRIALDVVRKISFWSEGLSDPIVIIGSDSRDHKKTKKIYFFFEKCCTI